MLQKACGMDTDAACTIFIGKENSIDNTPTYTALFCGNIEAMGWPEGKVAAPGGGLDDEYRHFVAGRTL